MTAQPPSLKFQPPLQPQSSAHLSEPRSDRRVRPAATAETIREDYFGNARLHGRVALVAGACSEVGRAVIAHYAREGAKIVVVYPSNAAVARECEWLARSEGSDCFLIRSRLDNATTCNDVVGSIVDYFGRLDIVVNCVDDSDAGATRELAQHPNSCADLLSRAALPHMASRGSIINTVASAHAPDPADRRAASAASLATIRPSIRVLAQAAAAHGIRANAVTAGATLAPSGRGRPSNASLTCLSQSSQPADIGPACVFLASDDASFITGQTLHITDRQYGEALLAG